jgi:prolyl oligopeptidase
MYLEEVLGERALETVRGWNARTLGQLQADPRFAVLEREALAIVNAKDKVPYGSYRGGKVYNFWQDEKNVRGLVRRTTLESYLAASPTWEILLDVDALAAREGKNWVYKGSITLPTDYDRCLLVLSDGGKDASVRREWSHKTKSFVPGGFDLPEAKADVIWADPDTLLVATDWGPGTTTASGYPFVVKRWRRGESLDAAVEIMRGEPHHVGVGPARIDTGEEILLFVHVAETFYESTTWWLPDGAEGKEKPVALPLPKKAGLSAWFKGELVFSIQEDWTPPGSSQTYAKGSLLSFDFDAFRKTRALPPLKIIYVPHARSSLEGVTRTASKLLVTIYENVVGAAFAYDFERGSWSREKIALPDNGSVGVVSAHRDTDVAFLSMSGFIQPDTLYLYDSATNALKLAKSAPSRFDASKLKVEQHEAVSADGERIPYFVITKKDIPLDGSTPALLYGYGGFQISLTPSYSGLRGKLWLERGGAFAIANIRGGGEFGPAWHQAALKTRRQTAFDDFTAVAQDLIARKITSPRRLGIMGGSNGGLLVGAVFAQRPELFNAVVCQVPLLDMLGYHKLLAGASWIGEYGDPEIPEERAFLEKISPYHNLRPERAYPEIFLVTSTKDDRVHPGHARKMAARLEEMGRPFLYYENIDGGHSAAANLAEAAKRTALEYVYLMRKLMD